ncbi:CDK2 associated cullin domain 1 [Cricetulus griseus]
MEECMEEEEMLTYEAMMDDQNHNNWEAAADNFRQPPPPPPSSSVPDPGRDPPGGSADRKGPKEGLPMGPPPLPEPNGVIMMLKSCDAAAAPFDSISLKNKAIALDEDFKVLEY